MSKAGFTSAGVPDQTGRCFLVTGANTGIGLEVSRVLAARGGRVLMACRSEAKAREAMTLIGRDVPGADIAFVPLDQADLVSVRKCAEIVSAEPRLDVLVNNAGVMMTPLERTAQGFELQLGVNHLGTFALTGLLLNKLAETPGARVVATSSMAHMNGRMRWDDLAAERGYDRYDRYNQSKLANLLFVLELDRRLKAAGSPVTAHACHPGVSPTELGRSLPGPLRLMFKGLGRFMNTPDAAAWPTLQAATDPGAVAGEYYGPQGLFELRGVSGVAKRRPQALDLADAKRLWDISIEMTGVDPGLPAA